MNPPVVELSPELGLEAITAPTDIIGTVTDDNLVGYKLQVAPAAGGEFVTIAEGNTLIANGKLGEFDPTTLQNDSYILRLTATDANGQTSSTEQIVEVTGELKLGNFRLSFTDLEIPVAGIPISVTRTYDTLTAKSQDDFGYGWRLEFRDTDLRTSVGEDELYEQTGIPSVGFEEGTRVYVTLPGGKRTGFTFNPVIDPEIYKALRMGAPLPQSMIFYNPAFETDDGEEVTLSAPKTQLMFNQNTGQYYHPSGTPYNPANSFFGGTYTLTTKEGIEYKIDGQSGDLLTLTDTNGNTLTYSDEGIVSSTGQSVTFERNAAGQIVAAVDPEGNKIQYEYDENGDLVAVTDREENTTRFEYHEERDHYLEEVIDPLGRSGVRSEYDESGRLSKMLDVNGEAVELVYDPDNSTQTVLDVFGNPTTYVYDGRGNVVTEVDALGGVTQFTYDEDNNVLSETNAEGEITTYTYDSQGNQLTQSNSLGNTTYLTYNNFNKPLSIANALGHTINYTYDDRGNQTAIQIEDKTIQRSLDANGKVTEITTADGSTSQFFYDQLGRVNRQKDALGNEIQYSYDSLGNLIGEAKQVTVAGKTQTLETRWSYDREGRVTSTTDEAGNTTQYQYDASGNIVASIDPLSRRTEYRYDDGGRLIETLYEDGSSTRNSYDIAGRLISKTDQLGRTTHFSYDALGRSIETILPDRTPENLSDNPKLQTEYDKVGRITAEIDPFGNRKEYEYDEAGRSILTRDALGNETTNTVNAIDYLTSSTDALGRTTNYFFDNFGREIETSFPDETSISYTYNDAGLRDSITDRSGRTSYIVWDELNRPIETILPDDTPEDLTDNPRIRKEYDELNRPIAEISVNGVRTEYEYDEVDRLIRTSDDRGTTTYGYDAVGNRISETNPLGHTTQFVYDDRNRLVKTVYPDGSYSQITYDAVGNIITKTDPANNTTRYEYDPQNQLIAVVDALGQRTEYFYDLAGNLIQVKNANNHSTFYEYDALNRPTASILPEGQRSEMTYDAVGSLLTRTDFNGSTINYEYDAVDRVIAKHFLDSTEDVTFSYTPTGKLETETDARGTTFYTYNASDHLIEQIEPDGRSIQYTYDIAENRTSVTTPNGTTRYVYDPYNRLSQVIDPDGSIARYTYNSLNAPIRKELPNGIVETRSYDELNRLTFIEQSNPTEILASYRYTLDPVGNRTVIEELGNRRTEYSYDNLYRVETETIADPQLGNTTTSYSYDPVGNRLSQNNSNQGFVNYTYDTNDRLIAETRGSDITEYAYDNNGNVISQVTNPTDRTHYQWDDENRLVRADVTNSEGTQQVNYQYNSQGIRVSSTVDGTETRYLVDSNRSHAVVLEEYLPEEELIASYVYGEDFYNYAHDLISQKRDSDRSFYHADALGNIRLLTDVDGSVTDAYRYDAYGKAIDSTGDTTNNYFYTGEQFDPVLNQYYLRARYYDPKIGRFTATDPFEGLQTDPLSLTKYLYVNGNPVNHTDPSGLLKFDTQIAVILHGILSQMPLVSPGGALQAAATVDSLVKIGWIKALIAAGGLGTSVAAIQQFVKQNGIPVLLHAGGNLQEHAEHIFDTQTGVGNNKRRVKRLEQIQAGRVPPPNEKDAALEKGKKIPRSLVASHVLRTGFYLPVRAAGENDRDFLNEALPVNAKLGLPPRTVARDEFPFVTTEQGGTPRYNANQVSVRYVPNDESNLQGNLIKAFYRDPGVDLNNPSRKGHPTRGRFVTLAWPFHAIQSGYFRRDAIFVGYTRVGQPPQT